jgi:UDP-2-acetamido-2,6-beta-L-arabino-hexul-4-ose reductase
MPHILFSSSTQEENEGFYGRSKKKGRELLEKWALKNGSKFSGLVIPNVFGSFGNPYYNSVVATFCHQLTHNVTPQVDVDAELKLIYVEELIKEILNILEAKHQVNSILKNVNKYIIPHTFTIKVSDLLSKLTCFKNDYLTEGIIPNLSNSFDRNLYNTFLTYIDHNSFFPFHLKLKTDERGTFVETLKINSGGQISFSITKPGITRGNHFHTRKAERFAVIKGKALISLRKLNTDRVLRFEIDGDNPSFVDMPIWYTHNIKNIGKEDLYTIFWINEFFAYWGSFCWRY